MSRPLIGITSSLNAAGEQVLDRARLHFSAVDVELEQHVVPVSYTHLKLPPKA